MPIEPLRLSGAARIVLAALIQASVSEVSARTIYVPGDVPTIADAVELASDGDSIEIAEGIYSPSTNAERFPIVLRGRRLALRGSGPWRTILDAAGLSRHVDSAAGDSSLVESVAFVGGRASGPGGSILMEGAATSLRRVRFMDCASEAEGDAIAVLGSRGTIEHALFVRNEGAGPTVLFTGGAPSVLWSTFDENAGPAILVRSGAARIERTVVARPGLGSGTAVGIVVEATGATDAISLVDNVFIECTQGTRPEGIGTRAGTGVRFADRALGDHRLIGSAGEPFTADPAGAYGGEGPLASPTGERRDAKGSEKDGALGPAIPNPFTPTTVIHYTIAAPEVVDLGVFNVLGQRIRTLFAGDRTPGAYEENWDGRDDLGQDMPAGVYYARITQGRSSETHPLVLVR